MRCALVPNIWQKKSAKQADTHSRDTQSLTSYASLISLNFFSAACLLSGFLSGCHFMASLRYAAGREWWQGDAG